VFGDQNNIEIGYELLKSTLINKTYFGSDASILVDNHYQKIKEKQQNTDGKYSVDVY